MLLFQYIQKTKLTENGNFFLFTANGKQKFVFLTPQTINGKQCLLFQQRCPSMLHIYAHIHIHAYTYTYTYTNTCTKYKYKWQIQIHINMHKHIHIHMHILIHILIPIPISYTVPIVSPGINPGYSRLPPSKIIIYNEYLVYCYHVKMLYISSSVLGWHDDPSQFSLTVLINTSNAAPLIPRQTGL
jgi:hypothetical protein